MMNAKAKEAWIKALRSEEYNQNYGALRKDSGYCCLGVLVDCYIKDGGTTLTWEEDEDSSGDFYVLNQYQLSESVELPADKDFENWLGDISGGVQQELVDMNDCRKFNFDQIANYIEENL